MIEEQDVLSFCDITGASTEVAEQFLEIADGSVETAVTLYLENGENTALASSTVEDVSASSSVINDSNDLENEQLLADEELARRLQESHQVRAPIAPKRDILAGDPTGMFSPSFSWSGSNEERRTTGRPSVFNQGDSTTGSITNIFDATQDEDEHRPSFSGASSFVEPTSTTSSSKVKRLADLFRPPFDIMFHGDFEQARVKAQTDNKWLMINIQNSTEFACQVLNRDLWSDPFVKEIIRESFTFLQYGSDSADGRRYSTFYSVRKYPHIAIIDSRTGERVKVWEKALNPTDFMMEVTEFLENNSAEEKPSPSTMKRPKVMKSVSDMSEEEQLNAAIAASLSGSSSPNIEDEELEKMEEEDTVETKPESVFDSIQSIERDEPTGGDHTTRIQIRMGDGSRVVRRFNKSDPVEHLFEFVKTKVEGQHFEGEVAILNILFCFSLLKLVFNRTQLIDVLTQTISDAGLSNAAVNCVLT
ncbi:hypothetical protein BY458DRAFT_488024 [Sporodiniella umbellata]|nr:hypothetical protein BY458DRAFT_488024 [Sporodiniella umbellata]